MATLGMDHAEVITVGSDHDCLRLERSLFFGILVSNRVDRFGLAVVAGRRRYRFILNGVVAQIRTARAATVRTCAPRFARAARCARASNFFVARSSWLAAAPTVIIMRTIVALAGSASATH